MPKESLLTNAFILSFLSIVFGTAMVWFFLASSGVEPPETSEASVTINDPEIARAPIAASLDDGLAAHWTFDGTDIRWSDTGNELRDRIGTNHGDINTSGMTQQSAAIGILGQGLTFNGSSDEAAIGDTSIDVKTLTLWIKPDSLTESILELSSSASIDLDSGDFQTTGFTDPTLYINGAKDDNTTTTDWMFLAITTNTAIDANDLTLGSVDGTDYFTGFMDSVRLYTRALTHEEIFRLYTSETGQIKTCGSTEDADGNLYGSVQIGTQCWMNENLNVGTRIDGSSNQTDNATIEKYCHGDLESNCDTYGGLYQWDEAMQYVTTEGAQGICPDGWHIPSDEEWKTLEMHLGMSQTDADDTEWRGTDQGTKLKIGGSSGLDIPLAGYRSTSGSFNSLGSYALLWSSSESGSSAWRRYLLSSHSEVYRSTVSQDYGFSLRCVRD